VALSAISGPLPDGDAYKGAAIQEVSRHFGFFSVGWLWFAELADVAGWTRKGVFARADGGSHKGTDWTPSASAVTCSITGAIKPRTKRRAPLCGGVLHCSGQTRSLGL